MSFVLDDSYSIAPNGLFDFRALEGGATSPNQRVATEFVPGTTGKVGRVTMRMKKIGTPTGNIFVKIYSDTPGQPNTVIGTSANVDVSTLTGTETDYNFDFTNGPTLISGTTYWISVEGDYTPNDTNYTKISATTPHYRADALAYNGSTWSAPAATYSLYFLEYYDSATTTTSTTTTSTSTTTTSTSTTSTSSSTTTSTSSSSSTSTTTTSTSTSTTTTSTSTTTTSTSTTTTSTSTSSTTSTSTSTTTTFAYPFSIENEFEDFDITYMEAVTTDKIALATEDGRIIATENGQGIGIEAEIANFPFSVENEIQ